MSLLPLDYFGNIQDLSVNGGQDTLGVSANFYIMAGCYGVTLVIHMFVCHSYIHPFIFSY